LSLNIDGFRPACRAAPHIAPTRRPALANANELQRAGIDANQQKPVPSSGALSGTEGAARVPRPGKFASADRYRQDLGTTDKPGEPW